MQDSGEHVLQRQIKAWWTPGSHWFQGFGAEICIDEHINGDDALVQRQCSKPVWTVAHRCLTPKAGALACGCDHGTPRHVLLFALARGAHFMHR